MIRHSPKMLSFSAFPGYGDTSGEFAYPQSPSPSLGMAKQTRKCMKQLLYKAYDELAPFICYFGLWAYVFGPMLVLMAGGPPFTSWAAAGAVSL